MIKIKRVYDAPSKDDGFRILIDRLWPRGLSKEKAKVDLWLKEIAPSDELRKWFCHDPSKWERFKERYVEELKNKRDLLNRVRRVEKDKGTITLLYASRDRHHNNAVILSDVLKSTQI